MVLSNLILTKFYDYLSCKDTKIVYRWLRLISVLSAEHMNIATKILKDCKIWGIKKVKTNGLRPCQSCGNLLYPSQNKYCGLSCSGKSNTVAKNISLKQPKQQFESYLYLTKDTYHITVTISSSCPTVETYILIKDDSDYIRDVFDLLPLSDQCIDNQYSKNKKYYKYTNLDWIYNLISKYIRPETNVCTLDDDISMFLIDQRLKD